MTFLRHGTKILRHSPNFLERGPGSVAPPPPPPPPGGLPYPWPTPEEASPRISGFAVDWGSYQRSWSGSDNWANFEDDDGTTYALWGDGNGPEGSERRSLGQARLVGKTPGSITGNTVIGNLGNWCDGFQVIGDDFANATAADPYLHGKVYAVVARAGVQHMFVTPKSLNSSPGGEDYFRYRRSVIPATLSSWSRASWFWTKEQDVFKPTFLRGGPGYTQAWGGGAHFYLYCLRHNPTAAGSHTHKPGGMYLARVPVGASLLTQANWQWFNGMTDGEGSDPVWSSTVATKRLVFEELDGTGWTLSADYPPDVGRIVLMYEHTTNNTCRLKIIESEYPWGPFRRVFRGQLIDPQKRHSNALFYFQPLAGSYTNGGENFTLVTTGVGITGTPTADAFIAIGASWNLS
jgi:hypothetical protein